MLRMLWADPQYMPEHLALWSLKRFGHRASSAVDRLRGSHPDADQAELNRLVIERQTRISMTEGAFVGGPFIVLDPGCILCGIARPGPDGARARGARRAQPQ